MTTDGDPAIEYSPLSGSVTQDGETVEVHIFRTPGSTAGWALEVVDSDGGATVWEDMFATDGEAYAEFRAVVESAGIASFRLDLPTAMKH
jgi:hypothetical protein